jgi:predicted permease
MSFMQDLKYALRTLRRNPAFTFAVVATLAVAIGMQTAIFSVFNAVVLRPLGYPHAERLVWITTVGHDDGPPIVTAPDFAEWRERAKSFDRMVAYGTGDHTVVLPAGAARVRTATVTHDFWDFSGAIPAVGRVPQPQDGDDVALVSHAFAHRWLAGEREVVGRSISMDGRKVTIVGVLPESFRFHLPGGLGSVTPKEVDVYRPMAVTSERTEQVALLSVVGRLQPDATLERARAEIATIRASIAQAHPNPFDDSRALRMTPLQSEFIGGAARALLVMLGAGAFVVLIACANAANLLLARASARNKELAVRLSLGAGRARMLRQLLIESLTLAAIGSAGGLLLAKAGIAAILRINATAIPRLVETTIDGRVLAAVLGTAVLTACLFGFAPAVALWNLDPHDALRRSGTGLTPARSGSRARRLLVAAEVALALILLVGAGLLMKSAWRMTSPAPGFQPRQILTATIELRGQKYDEPTPRLAFADALLARLKTQPGVDAATISTHGYMLTAALAVEGEQVPSQEELARKAPIYINATSADLHRVVGFQLARGRWFKDGEAGAVLNETLARRDFPGRDPIGLRFRLTDNGAALTVVGITRDLKYSQLDAPSEPEVYVPYALTDALFEFTTLARASNDATALAPAFRSVVADIDNTQTPVDVMSLERSLSDAIAPRNLNLTLFAAFASAALFLAAVGIYGVMAYSVAQRVHEIGVRMALGAQRSDVVSMVVRQGMRVTLAGIAAGVFGAFALSRLMENLLYEVEPTDPFTFVAVTVVLAATGFLACCLPALKAALVDPIAILRYE